MSLLSPAERERIREEMVLREELREEIAAGRDAPAPRRRWTFLRSPVLATAIGGIFLNVFASVNAHYERRRAREQALFDKRLAVVSSFAQDLPPALSLSASMAKLKLWLKDPKHQGEDARSDIGQSRAEVLKSYEDFFKMRLSAKNETSILEETRFYFSTPRILPLIAKLGEAASSFRRASADEDLMAQVKAADHVRGEILDALVEDLRQSSR